MHFCTFLLQRCLVSIGAAVFLRSWNRVCPAALVFDVNGYAKMSNEATTIPDTKRPSLFQRFLPPALLIIGVAITVAWAVLLGWGLLALAKMAR